MLELWGMRSTSSLPSYLDPFWPGVNDWIVWGWLEKTGGHKISYACVNWQNQMFLLPTQGERGWLIFWGVICESWWGKDSDLNTSCKDMAKRKFPSTFFRVRLQEQIYTLKATLHVKNTTEFSRRPGRKFSLRLLFLSLHDMLFLFS